MIVTDFAPSRCISELIKSSMTGRPFGRAEIDSWLIIRIPNCPSTCNDIQRGCWKATLDIS